MWDHSDLPAGCWRCGGGHEAIVREFCNASIPKVRKCELTKAGTLSASARMLRQMEMLHFHCFVGILKAPFKNSHTTSCVPFLSGWAFSYDFFLKNCTAEFENILGPLMSVIWATSLCTLYSEMSEIRWCLGRNNKSIWLRQNPFLVSLPSRAGRSQAAFFCPKKTPSALQVMSATTSMESKSRRDWLVPGCLNNKYHSRYISD